MEFGLLTSILFFVIFWSYGWLFFFHVLKQKTYYITYLHFTILSIIIIYLFKETFLSLVSDFFLLPIIILVVAIVMLFFIFHFYSSKNMSFPLIITQVLFQQALIVALIFSFLKSGMSFLPSLGFFFLTFVVLHIPLVKLMSKAKGFYFLFAAVPAAIIFPLLIVKINYGFALSFAVHLLFYFATVIYFHKTKKGI